MFKEWVRGSHIIYERNPDYWDAPKPYIDRMVCKFVPDPGARSIAFENGSADIGYRTPVALTDLERLKKLPHLALRDRRHELLLQRLDSCSSISTASSSRT